MARRKHLDPPVQLTLTVPTGLLAKIDLALMDPLTKKPKYGARSKLTVQLWEKWLTENSQCIEEIQNDDT